MIEVNHLDKRYKSTHAVNDVSFVVPEGQVVGFLGPNGSGKSTTMRLMLGLDFGSGETLFDGKPLASHKEVTRIVGAHLDAKYFHPKRSAVNHLRMLATEAQVSQKRISEVIELMGLQGVANKAPKGFSLGMGQRLGLAGAILTEPRHLLLDEPANGLDPQSIHWLRDFLKDYAAKGNTVFVSSHLLSEMELMADHLVVIARGKMISDEPMASFVARSSGNDVLVRTSQDELSTLQNALTASGVESTAIEANALSVKNASAEQVGQLAFQANVPVLELVARQVSLESAFLELTSGEQEYRTGAQA
ncbi:MAG: ATP-binding cassette domain-containing protein [Actinobacteria bacterium]|nr:ATP-binding cassette domain-containing protein [Actinomycetota bacterium]NBY15549.1 ATP-binding cassette domain-containing protein [Actinomycetota bacterium]